MPELAQAKHLAPYIAIISGILLTAAIGAICYRQFGRSGDPEGSSRRPTLWHSRIARLFRRGIWSPSPAALIHDPNASRARDLDDPFVEQSVRDAIGTAIAKAARKT